MPRHVAAMLLLLAAGSGCAYLGAERDYSYGVGGYTGANINASPLEAGGEIGVFAYPSPWCEGHLGLGYFGASNEEHWFTSLNAGLRCESPTELSPFVGGGFVAGYAFDDAPNQFVGFNPIGGYFAGVYPEAGVHYWVTESVRLTSSASYLVTTEGRDHDFLMFGFHLGLLAAY